MAKDIGGPITGEDLPETHRFDNRNNSPLKTEWKRSGIYSESLSEAARSVAKDLERQKNNISVNRVPDSGTDPSSTEDLNKTDVA